MMPSLTILEGDWLEQAKAIPDASVHCCVTSPPYWGLRDYGVAGQIGLEKTPEEYVAKIVAVFREVKRVLRDDGTLWLNLGDSYAGSWGDSGHRPERDGRPGVQREKSTEWLQRNGHPLGPKPPTAQVPGLKPKDLCGIPWRVAFALQQDGWYLRSDIIWHKPNPMPESVTDRPTKSHEYLFLLSKSQSYFYDAEAIKERSVDPESLRPEGRNPRNDDKFAKAFLDEHRNGMARTRDGFAKLEGVCYPTRNKRTVWTIPTAPYSEAHFATFPPDLVKPCILAGTSARGCCPKCGAPWERMISEPPIHGPAGVDYKDAGSSRGVRSFKNGQDVAEWKALHPTVTLGWRPTCECAELGNEIADLAGHPASPSSFSPVPCTVLDPFFGSGTTGMVALELGRNAVGCELSPKYVKLIRQRTNVTPGFAL